MDNGCPHLFIGRLIVVRSIATSDRKTGVLRPDVGSRINRNTGEFVTRLATRDMMESIARPLQIILKIDTAKER